MSARAVVLRRSLLPVALALATFTAFSAGAATNWPAGLDAGSKGEAQAATIGNLTITATTSPLPGALLYPGAVGDVVLSISNPNPYPVTLHGFWLPTNTTYASGYSDAALTNPVAACSAATPSYVIWWDAQNTSVLHNLATPLVIAASGAADNPLVVTLRNDASMGTSAPTACRRIYFAMPAFANVFANSGASGPATTSPAQDGW
jgi:hypothetical protein